MVSEQDDAVFQELDEDDRSSQSHDEEDDLENDDVLPEEEDDEDDEDEDDDEEEEEEEEEDLNLNSSAVPLAVPSASSSVSASASAVTIAAVPNGTDHLHCPLSIVPITAAPKRPLITPFETVILPDRKPQPIDETRRLFQRLWTDEDEIELLRGFLDYTTQRGGGAAGGGGGHDTALFYDQIKSRLQLDFNKNQLVEKLRRLKKKYRNVVGKISSGKEVSFKSPHDQATFEISQKIWSSLSAGKIDGNLDDEDGEVKPLDYHHQQQGKSISTPPSRKRSRSSRSGGSHMGPPPLAPVTPLGVRIDENCNHNNDDDNNNNKNNGGSHNVGGGFSNVNVSGLIEDTVKNCVSPLFKELLGGVVGAAAASSGPFGGRGVAGLVANAAVPWGFGGGGEVMMVADERWRKQHILELEVYSKRLELVQDQIRAQLEELRSMGGGGGG